jgi:hypothetical protein
MNDFREGFERVMAVVREQHKARTGSERGAAAWLAKELKTSRQGIFNYQKRNGFPYHLARKLMKITGLTEADIWPGGIAVSVDFPPKLWDEVVVKAEEVRRPPPETVVELVKIGLKVKR